MWFVGHERIIAVLAVLHGVFFSLRCCSGVFYMKSDEVVKSIPKGRHCAHQLRALA